jgi:hypothetical protein
MSSPVRRSESSAIFLLSATCRILLDRADEDIGLYVLLAFRLPAFRFPALPSNWTL